MEVAQIVLCLIGWGCTIHQQQVSWEVRPPANKCPNMTLNNLMVRFRWCWSFGEYGVPLSLPMLPGRLSPGMVTPDRVLSMGQIELNCVLMPNWILWIRTVWLNWIAWNRNVFEKTQLYEMELFLTLKLCCIAVIHIQPYTCTCGNKINNNDERTHFFRKIYLSHFIRKGCERVAKRLCVRGELETGETATYWPQVPLSFAALLSRSAGLLNRGPEGPALSESWFSLQHLISNSEFVCGTGLYNCLTFTCFLWALHLHPIQPVHSQGYTLISSTGCTCYLHRCISYLTARPSVNMLQLYLR